jgi:hypothetical protein
MTKSHKPNDVSEQLKIYETPKYFMIKGLKKKAAIIGPI